jgi:hypothetical protein
MDKSRINCFYEENIFFYTLQYKLHKMTFDREFKLKCDHFINLLNMLIKRAKILYY